MLWKIYQITVFGWVVWLYTTQIHTGAPVGTVFLFAYICAFLATLFLAYFFEVLRKLISLPGRVRQQLLPRRARQHAGHEGDLRIDAPRNNKLVL